MNEQSPLAERVERLLMRAARVFAGTATGAEVLDLLDRFSQPPIIVLAGRAKAGKSTLLNALLDDAIAPSDATECTLAVANYHWSEVARVTAVSRGRQSRSLAFRRERGDEAVHINLDGVDLDSLDHLDIAWPSPGLRKLGFVDTPGVGSATVDLAARTEAMAANGRGAVARADALIYLIRHLHPSDLGFLEVVQLQALGEVSPVNALAVLARSDEVGGGATDAMAIASEVAGQLAGDARLRRLVQTVVPVNALLAVAVTRLSERDLALLTQLSRLPARERALLLASGDHVVGLQTSIELAALARAEILGRLGLYGLRCAVDLVAREERPDLVKLRQQLLELSGLPGLRWLVDRLFLRRAGALKARSALSGLALVVAGHGGTAAQELIMEIEVVAANAHELAELGALQQLRCGATLLSAADRADAERLLGGWGTTAWERLGLPPATGPELLAQGAAASVVRWRTMVSQGRADPGLVRLASVLVRSAEALYVAVERE